MTLYSSDMSRFVIGNAVVPGVLQSVSYPSRDVNWNVVQGVAGVGAATIYRGIKLVESIVVTTLLAKRGASRLEYDRAVEEWSAFLVTIHPAPTKKPPAWDVDYPTLRLLHPPVVRVSHKSNKVEPWKAGPPVAAYNGVLELIEYKPLKLAKPGPPDPAQLDSRDVPPRDAEERELAELLEKAKGL